MIGNASEREHPMESPAVRSRCRTAQTASNRCFAVGTDGSRQSVKDLVSREPYSSGVGIGILEKTWNKCRRLDGMEDGG